MNALTSFTSSSIIGANQAGTEAQRFRQMINGSPAKDQAQWFCQINDGAPQDEAHWHNLYILDFVSGAHWQAHRHSCFGKYIIGLLKMRHIGTI